MPESEGVREAWSRYAERFAAEEADAERRPPLRRLVEMCALPPRSRVLDVATGAGFTAFAFARAGCSVVALDPAHEMLLAARRGWTDRGLPGVARVVEAWAEDVPLRSRSFDAVVSHRAPHQFEDPGRFLVEAARLLEPGGIVGIADQSPPDGLEQWHNRLERLRDPTHRRALSPRSWRRLVDDAGLRWEQSDVVQQPHDVLEWLDRVECPTDRRRAVLAELEQAPGEARQAYGVAAHGGRLVMRTPQLVFVARA